MAKEYVAKVEGSYRIMGTRVSLASLVDLFHEGISAEGIAESYPVLTIEQVYGALAFYLANQGTIDAYLRESERGAQIEHQRSLSHNSELIAKLRRARHENRVSG